MIKAPISLLALAGFLTACGGSNLLYDPAGRSALERLEADVPPSEVPLIDDQLQAAEKNFVLLQWSRPSQRESGEYLEGDDIGGYELRYREPGQDEQLVVDIDDGWVESYQVEGVEGAYDFAIAVYDRDGIYSEFAILYPD